MWQIDSALLQSEVIMDVIPAIDLRTGKCVRLIQGQYHRQITYKDDPVEQAKLFQGEGAERLHIIDLDGAKVGTPINTEAIKAITAAVDMKIQVGGGIRHTDSINRMLDMGIERLIIGTRAVSDFDWFVEMANKFQNKLILGLDTRGSKVAIRGWTQDSPEKLWDFAAKAANMPIAAIIYTDITKDGMLDGPNLERTKALVDAVNIPVIAAGGVTEADDITKLAQLGVAGAVIGRGLYEGTINLTQAIKAAKDATADKTNQPPDQ